MSVIVPSQSLADGATLTTGAFPYSATGNIVASCTNGIPSPNQVCQVTLQLSLDGVTWTNARRRWFGSVPNLTYNVPLNLAEFISTGAWQYYRLVFGSQSGAAVTITASDSTGLKVISLPLTATTSTTGGAVLAWQPPEGNPVIIERVVEYIATASAGAANLSAGIAANATTSSVTFCAATAVGSGAPKIIDSNTTAAVSQLMTGAQFLTITGSASTAGMVGSVAIFYTKPT